MTGQRVGMVIRPPTGGGLLAVEGWGGRWASPADCPGRR